MGITPPNIDEENEVKNMIIGIAKEIKNNELRVALTSAGDFVLQENGHKILMETGVGSNCGFNNADYQKARAQIINDKKTNV